MKNFQEIYDSIKKKVYEKTEIDIKQGTVLDYVLLASSEIISEAYKEIEDNKTPHIYTSLEGEKLDDMAILCGLTRKENESDKNFLYRLVNWNTANKSSNLSAIETVLMTLEYSSNVTYVPHAYGCGTSAAYIIPKIMTEENKALAIEETKKALKAVTSPSTYIDYIIPTILDVKLSILFKTDDGDKTSLKNILSKKIADYVNSIAPGDYLEIGQINKIGINENNIDYFNVSAIMINGKEVGDIEILQKIESKFLLSEINSITWVEVE